VFLSLFDDNPSVKTTFCPPKECYDPELNHDGRYGIPMPPFSQLVEQGKVCAINFPVAMNPGLARTIGTLMKQDFQRAVLNRIPLMETEPARGWREIHFLCDEYQSFATVGESDPTGGEKFFALSTSQVHAFRSSPHNPSARFVRPCRVNRGGLSCRRSERKSSWH